jgi:hypothetical protein
VRKQFEISLNLGVLSESEGKGSCAAPVCFWFFVLFCSVVDKVAIAVKLGRDLAAQIEPTVAPADEVDHQPTLGVLERQEETREWHGMTWVTRNSDCHHLDSTLR